MPADPHHDEGTEHPRERYEEPNVGWIPFRDALEYRRRREQSCVVRGHDAQVGDAKLQHPGITERTKSAHHA